MKIFHLVGWISRWSVTVFLLPVSAALAQSDPQALQWLQRIHSATQKMSYTGVFVYQHGQQLETSRITRYVDAFGPREKLEPLDGAQREIIRSRDQVTCYMPETMTVKVDRSVGEPRFPEILPDQIKDLTENYVIRKGEVERVAGFDCQVIVLEPKDRMRYGHKLWADIGTGMLLKAKTLTDKQETVDTFTFTQLRIGGIDREQVRSRFAGRLKEWRVENSGATKANLADAGWVLRPLLPGFRKVGEMRRSVGALTGVGHIVLSDGLAAVSIFIEPVAGRQPPVGELLRQGATNVFTRQLAEHWITVVGEAPIESIKVVANAVEFRKR